MKNYIFVAGLCLAIASANVAAETPKKPAATKSVKKEVKKHKKFDGEKVPEKAPTPAKKK
jgi:hypothetical protein